MWSRQAQPEAVPPLPLRVGSASDPIVRILALRDGLVIFKAKDGAYILRGDSPGNFNVQVLDSTAKIIAPESLSVVNGLIYGLFEGGICSVSDTSVEIISAPVKDKIQTLFGTALQETKDLSFGISYEASNLYILCLPSSSSSEYADYQLTYDVSTNLFSEWNIHTTAGYVSSVNQKLYLGSADSPYVKQERKAFDSTDYCDYLGLKTITSYSGTTVVITSGIDSFSVGDLISQGSDTTDAYITAIDLVNSSVTIDYERDWDIGVNTVNHYSRIECVLEFNPVFGDNVAGLKFFTELSMKFKQPILRNATIGFTNDSSAGVSEVTIEGSSSGDGWGEFVWGEGVWGSVTAPEQERLGVPRGVSRSSSLKVRMTHSVAQSPWQLEGFSLKFEPLSIRVAR
jgi:hypothetical protein